MNVEHRNLRRVISLDYPERYRVVLEIPRQKIDHSQNLDQQWEVVYTFLVHKAIRDGVNEDTIIASGVWYCLTPHTKPIVQCVLDVTL